MFHSSAMFAGWIWQHEPSQNSSLAQRVDNINCPLFENLLGILDNPGTFGMLISAHYALERTCSHLGYYLGQYRQLGKWTNWDAALDLCGFVAFIFASLADAFIQSDLQLRVKDLVQGFYNGSFTVLGFKLPTFQSVSQSFNHWTNISSLTLV